MRAAWALAFLISTAARAEVQAHDIVLLGTALTLISMDTLTSMDIKNHPDQHEGNRLIVRLTGTDHPSDRQFITMGLLAGAATTATWAVLPDRWRWLAPTAVICVEFAVVYHNLVVGGLSIPF